MNAMIRSAAVALWLLAGLADVLTWADLAARERSQHVVTFPLVGSIVLAILSINGRHAARRGDDVRGDAPHRSDPGQRSAGVR